MSKNASNKLPKHIAQMVEKNNLVMAIKTLSEEQNISMGEAKEVIDSYELDLKQQQTKKVEAITKKQQKKKGTTPSSLPIKDNQNLQQLNKGLDKRLDSMGYKQPKVPYWAKRVFIILLVMTVLIFVCWQLMP